MSTSGDSEVAAGGSGRRKTVGYSNDDLARLILQDQEMSVFTMENQAFIMHLLGSFGRYLQRGGMNNALVDQHLLAVDLAAYIAEKVSTFRSTYEFDVSGVSTIRRKAESNAQLLKELEAKALRREKAAETARNAAASRKSASATDHTRKADGNGNDSHGTTPDPESEEDAFDEQNSMDNNKMTAACDLYEDYEMENGNVVDVSRMLSYLGNLISFGFKDTAGGVIALNRIDAPLDLPDGVEESAAAAASNVGTKEECHASTEKLGASIAAFIVKVLNVIAEEVPRPTFLMGAVSDEVENADTVDNFIDGQGEVYRELLNVAVARLDLKNCGMAQGQLVAALGIGTTIVQKSLTAFARPKKSAKEKAAEKREQQKQRKEEDRAQKQKENEAAAAKKKREKQEASAALSDQQSAKKQPMTRKRTSSALPTRQSKRGGKVK